MIDAEVHMLEETEFGYFLLVCGRESMSNVAEFLYDLRVNYKITYATCKDEYEHDLDPFSVDHVQISISKNDQLRAVKHGFPDIIRSMTHVG